jgi:hypothetical protein
MRKTKVFNILITAMKQEKDRFQPRDIFKKDKKNMDK